MDWEALITIVNNEHAEKQQQMEILLLDHQKSVADDNNFFMLTLTQISNRNRHIKMEGYYEDWLNRFLEYDFFSLFRMNRSTFLFLLNKVDSPELHKNYTGGNIQIDAEKQLLMTLWWLGKGEVLLSVANKFNVALSTVYNCTQYILERLLNIQNEYISWPDVFEVEDIEAEFRDKSGYPGVIGAIDVCNIPIKVPEAFQADYFDRKFKHSIKLQAVTTASKIFTNICVGFSGSVHDSRVFRNSNLYTEVEENGNSRKYFPENRHHIVGDSAYPLLNWLMTPYRDNGNLYRVQRYHNTCHSVTRIVVENTFGLLKSRWRILKYVNVNNIEKAIRIIAACCILHNFCYVNSDFWDEYEPIGQDDEDDENNARILNVYAVNKRNFIANNL